jgi:putative endonuclease
MMIRDSYVYIMTNKDNRVLFTGVTSNLTERVWQHKEGQGSHFTTKYKTTKLVYFETFGDIRDAIDFEKQIKAGSRARKLALIQAVNSEWRDLYEDLMP